MNKIDNETENTGNEVLKAIGALNDVVSDSEKSQSDEETTAEDVGNWITIIGKAVLAIFKL